jgi:hypothetical protein
MQGTTKHGQGPYRVYVGIWPLRRTEMGWVEETFKAAQSPFGWLTSAERLEAAAETILEHEEAGALAYFNALEAAQREAVEKSYSSNDKTGLVEVRHEPPNYLPAQLLYAFALENLTRFQGTS